ncbi:MAG TPA: hypothetical protein VGO40_16825 [Longimicrobium sp.]|jgi:hypothetical protein|nr:hypothetical protein [Longimicrobium sp.]
MKVKLEELRVESFATTSLATTARGTVNAHDASLATCRFSCPPHYTCPECASPVMDEPRRED